MCVCVRETSNEEEVFDLKESKESHGSVWKQEREKGKSYDYNLKSNNNCNRKYFIRMNGSKIVKKKLKKLFWDLVLYPKSLLSQRAMFVA